VIATPLGTTVGRGVEDDLRDVVGSRRRQARAWVGGDVGVVVR